MPRISTRIRHAFDFRISFCWPLLTVASLLEPYMNMQDLGDPIPIVPWFLVGSRIDSEDTKYL